MKARRKMKSGLLLCFRPSRVAGDEVEGEKQKSASLSSTSSASLSSSSRERGDSSLSDEEAREKREVRRRKMAARRILVKIITSTVFVTHLKKAQSGKVRRGPNRPLLRKLSDEVSDPKSTGEDDPKSDAVFSSSFLSNSSSSSSSNFPARERKLRRKRPEPPAPEPRNYGTATAICLLVLSLFVMLFWGRICAIMWTSACLCFVPRRGSDVAAEAEEEGAAVEVLASRWSEKYDKKRVVLGGILERNRRV